VLRRSVLRLHDYLVRCVDLRWGITIVDNASVDDTPAIAASLARQYESVRFRRLEQKGRGRALRAAWSASDADVVAYMDVDLSTDLAHLPALIEPLLSDRADLAIGSRLLPGARVTRGLKRELISRAYDCLLGLCLGAGFSDAQCGFKAGRREVIQALLPAVEDNGWFFDTELLYLAQRNAFAIHEVPVRWVEDHDSRVRIVDTALDDLKGVARLQRRTRDGRDRIAAPGAPTTPTGAVRARTRSHCFQTLPAR